MILSHTLLIGVQGTQKKPPLQPEREKKLWERGLVQVISLLVGEPTSEIGTHTVPHHRNPNHIVCGGIAFSETNWYSHHR